MRRLPTTVITRDGGEPHVVPRVNTHGIGTQVASQSTAFAGTDPVLGSVVLSAYDFGQLTNVSNDLMEDSGVDVMALVSKEIGGAIGRLEDGVAAMVAIIAAREFVLAIEGSRMNVMRHDAALCAGERRRRQ